MRSSEQKDWSRHAGFRIGTNTIPQFLEAFQLHLKRLNAQSDEVRRFIYHYLPTGVLNQIAAAAVDKMAVTLADGIEHSSALIKPPVVYDISTIPTELERAAVWFAGEHGSYSEFLRDMWQTFEEVTRTSSIFCHVMYGWGKDGGWVHLGVWPMEKNPHSEALIVRSNASRMRKSAHFLTTRRANNASADSGSNEDNVLAAADILTYFASREQLKAADIHDALEFLVRLLDPGNAHRFKGRLLFGSSVRRPVITRALAQTQGSRLAAARILGLQRTYLSRLIKTLGVH